MWWLWDFFFPQKKKAFFVFVTLAFSLLPGCENSPKKKQGGVVSHCGLAIYIKKKVSCKAKEELWKLKYFTMQKCNLQKIL
jgi:hypothetical protein